jgi:hypothetical protein
MNSSSKTSSNEPVTYQIRVGGHLGTQWEDWFGESTITLDANGETLITCQLVDQSALYGLLKKVRDLGLPLIAFNPISSNEVQVPQTRDSEKEKK